MSKPRKKETGRFKSDAEKKNATSKETMLPISFIPMEAIHHLYEIFDFVMKDYPQYSVPDENHPLSLQRYFAQKKMIPDKLEWSQLNAQQQKELHAKDRRERLKNKNEKVTTLLDELFNDEDDEADFGIKLWVLSKLKILKYCI